MNARPPIYLDYAATTPVDARVLSAMMPYFQEHFGNPSSIHIYGQRAEAALEKSRETLARYLHCQPEEVIFTSCGSESDNLALRGIALAENQRRGANHILISPVEHHAVSRTAEQLAAHFGFELEFVPADPFGIVSPDEVKKRLRPTTAVVSVIYANNEIGSINPIAEIGKVCRQHGIPFHTDAVQAAAYLPIEVEALHVDCLSIGAHKFYGPKGVGALYLRNGTPILPILTGGGQEFGLRAGTSNVPYIVGMAEAFRLANEERASRTAHLTPLRDQIIHHVLETIPEVQLSGHATHRLPNHASFVFHHVDGNALLAALDAHGFCCSSGSACKTGSPEPSEVLTHIGFTREWALGSLRVTLGTPTQSNHVQEFLATLPYVVENLRRTRRGVHVA